VQKGEETSKYFCIAVKNLIKTILLLLVKAVHAFVHRSNASRLTQAVGEKDFCE